MNEFITYLFGVRDGIDFIIDSLTESNNMDFKECDCDYVECDCEECNCEKDSDKYSISFDVDEKVAKKLKKIFGRE